MATINMPRAQSIIHPQDILRNWIATEFNIPRDMRVQCDESFLRIWQPSALTTIKEGVLSYKGEDWIVHWQSTLEVARSSEWIAFSFRKYRGTNYVVIKSYNQAKKTIIEKDEQ